MNACVTKYCTHFSKLMKIFDNFKAQKKNENLNFSLKMYLKAKTICIGIAWKQSVNYNKVQIVFWKNIYNYSILIKNFDDLLFAQFFLKTRYRTKKWLVLRK